RRHGGKRHRHAIRRRHPCSSRRSSGRHGDDCAWSRLSRGLDHWRVSRSGRVHAHMEMRAPFPAATRRSGARPQMAWLARRRRTDAQPFRSFPRKRESNLKELGPRFRGDERMERTTPNSAQNSRGNDRVLVQFEEVQKRFGGSAAVQGVTLSIFEGEFFGLLGPSGCGKTTLLRMLAGLETPDAGRILLDGQDLAPIPPYRRPINMMFQNYALFPHLNVHNNVAFGLRQEGLPRAEIDARAAE